MRQQGDHEMGRNVLGVFLATLALSSCATNETGVKHGTCRTLKSNLVFSGSTSNVRNAEMQQAEEPLQKVNYDRENCSQ
jgi:hypothetical protein